MSGPEMNPRDDEQDEEEIFVLAIAEMVQACELSKAKVHLRSYIDHVRPNIELPAPVSDATRTEMVEWLYAVLHTTNADDWTENEASEIVTKILDTLAHGG